MADARRIIFGASVIPKETTTSEEGFTKTSMLVDKKFGSKGTTDINKDQWGEGWTSMFHPKLTWENADGIWQSLVDYWNGKVAITGTPVRLGPNDSTVVLFVYVKNIGDYTAEMTLDGSNYDIIIPPGGSVSFRGTSNLTMQNVKVQRVSSDDTEIEYIIAK